MTLLAWLLGSKAGRIVAFAALTAGVVSLVLWRVFVAGKAAAKTQQTQRTIEVLRKAIEVENEIARMSPAQRRDALRRWVR